jgi:protein-S-isoprenylcysteine O-methyltransferase Ste14
MRGSLQAAPIAIMWIAWLGYWLIAARDVKPVRRQESLGSRLGYVVPIAIGAVLLASGRLPVHWLDDRFLPPSAAVYWAGTLVLAAGLAFMVWARRTLGRNWSGRVTLKEDHELIRGGPYRLVRHPIYTGLLLALLGTAIAFGQWRDLIALGLITLAVLHKMRVEERFLAESFPPDYARYRAEVPALIPFMFHARRVPQRDRNGSA